MKPAPPGSPAAGTGAAPSAGDTRDARDTRARPAGGPALWRAAWASRWQTLAPRERWAVTLAAWVLGAAALWWGGLQQPLNQGRAAQQRLAGLQAQHEVMRRQAAEARSLQAATALPAGQAEQALQAATARLAPRGRLQIQGDRAVLTVDGATGTELQAWWTEARAGARARVVEMQLTRQASGLSGTLVVAWSAAGGPP
ncbi:MAG: type II secretion system protein GspM [Rubrivivax sp.]